MSTKIKKLLICDKNVSILILKSDKCVGKDVFMKNNFRVILAKQRKKVSDIHKLTGISKTTLTGLYYERTKNPDTQTLLKVASCLGVTLDELLTPEE